MKDHSKQIAASPLDYRNIDPNIKRVLRQRGVDDPALSKMTALEVFDEYCGFYGLLKMGTELANAFDAAREKQKKDAAAPAPEKVFADLCARRQVRSMAPTLLEVLNSIRSCERQPAAPLKHAA